MSSSSPNKDDENAESLLTKKAFEMALSPPRIPPYGTFHRAILMGEKHRTAGNKPWDYNDGGGLSSGGRAVRERMLLDFVKEQENNEKNQKNQKHPHLLDHPPVFGDRVSRYISTIIPTSLLNHWRDSGAVRSYLHTQVRIIVPSLALFSPVLTSKFLNLSKKRIRIPYGDRHPSQFIDMFLPTTDATTNKQQQQQQQQQQQPRGLIFFVHGGAWGSGMPWMYRLIALPFLKINIAVAIVGYRTYPAGDCNTQVYDLEQAACELAKRYPQICCQSTEFGVCVLGHSSGSHITLLMLVERMKRRMMFDQAVMFKRRKKQQQPQQQKNTNEHVESKSSSSRKTVKIASYCDDEQSQPQPQQRTMRIDSFIGMSGPYDISQHFDHEAERGVEELSPMKAACGYTRSQFRFNSPGFRLVNALAQEQEEDFITINNNNKKKNSSDDGDDGSQKSNHGVVKRNKNYVIFDKYVPPRGILLLHGIEDNTVPFCATSEAARHLRSIGITHSEEIYLAQTGHEEVVMQIMIGGRAQSAVIDWLQQKRLVPEIKKENYQKANQNTKLIVNSKL